MIWTSVYGLSAQTITMRALWGSKVFPLLLFATAAAAQSQTPTTTSRPTTVPTPGPRRSPPLCFNLTGGVDQLVLLVRGSECLNPNQASQPGGQPEDLFARLATGDQCSAFSGPYETGLMGDLVETEIANQSRRDEPRFDVVTVDSAWQHSVQRGFAGLARLREQFDRVFGGPASYPRNRLGGVPVAVPLGPRGVGLLLYRKDAVSEGQLVSWEGLEEAVGAAKQGSFLWPSKGEVCFFCPTTACPAPCTVLILPFLVCRSGLVVRGSFASFSRWCIPSAAVR